MVRAFREKKMKKAGTWTEADEEEKNKQAEEKDMFSDYDQREKEVVLFSPLV